MTPKQAAQPAFHTKLSKIVLLIAAVGFVGASASNFTLPLPYKSRVLAFMSFDEQPFLQVVNSKSAALAEVISGPVKRVLGAANQGAYLDDVLSVFKLPLSVAPQSRKQVTIGGWFFPMSASVPNVADDADAHVTVMTNAEKDPKSGRSIIFQRGVDGKVYWALSQPGFVLVSDVEVIPYKWVMVLASFSEQHQVALIAVNSVVKQELVKNGQQFSSQQSKELFVGGVKEMSPSLHGFYGIADNIFVYNTFIRNDQVPAILDVVDRPSVPSPVAGSAGYAARFVPMRLSKAWAPQLPSSFHCLHDFQLAFWMEPHGGDSHLKQGVVALGNFDGRHMQMELRTIEGTTAMQISLTFRGISDRDIEWIPEITVPIRVYSHVWLNWNGSQLVLAVNDNQIETWSASSVQLPSYRLLGCDKYKPSSLLLGAEAINSSIAGNFFNGVIDELRLHHQGQVPTPTVHTASYFNSSTLLREYSHFGLHFTFNEGFGQTAEALCQLQGAECGSVWLDMVGGPHLALERVSQPTVEPHWLPPIWTKSGAVWDDWVSVTEDFVQEFALNASVVHAVQPGEPHLKLTQVPKRSKIVRPVDMPSMVRSFNGHTNKFCPVILEVGKWQSLRSLSLGDIVLPGEPLCFVPPANASPLVEELQYKVVLRNQTVVSEESGKVEFVVYPVDDGLRLKRPSEISVNLTGISVYDPDENDRIVYVVDS